MNFVSMTRTDLKQAEREQLERDRQAFLARGGKETIAPANMRANITPEPYDTPGRYKRFVIGEGVVR